MEGECNCTPKGMRGKTDCLGPTRGGGTCKVARRQEQSRQALEAQRQRRAEMPDPVDPLDELAGICEDAVELLRAICGSTHQAALDALADRISRLRYIVLLDR